MMRLCPATPIVVRRPLEPMTLGGYEITAGTTVAPCVHLVHRNPQIYPQPLKFRPERFLEQPAGTYTWIRRSEAVYGAAWQRPMRRC